MNTISTERLKEIAALLPGALPLARHDTPDYAEVTGPSMQAMSTAPDALLCLNDMPAILSELISRRSTEDGKAVAWVVLLNYGNGRWSNEMLTDRLPSDDPTQYKIVRPLYAHPPAQSHGVKVRRLEWTGPDVNGDRHARSILAVYTIRKQQGSMGFWLTEVGGYHSSIDKAKAAAQADYEARILSALVPTPAVEAEGVTVTDAMVERANKASVLVYVPGLSDAAYEQSRKDDPIGFEKTIKAMRAALTAALSTGDGREGE